MRKVRVIAEIGVNHDGSLDKAMAMIDAAAECGADVVKFQAFCSREVATAEAGKAAYQVENTGGGSQREMIERLELKPEAYPLLAARCRKRGVAFMASPFDVPSVALLHGLDMETFKIPSGETANPLLLLAVARLGNPVILSTGMCLLGEIEMALGVLAFGYLGWDRPGVDRFLEAYSHPDALPVLRRKVTLMHCTSQYPTPLHLANLSAIGRLAAAFGLPVGYSDHTEGIEVPLAAAVAGACVLEKHFTLDRSAPGPDHRASAEPDVLRRLIHALRTVESAWGGGFKAPTQAERETARLVRGRVVTLRPVRCGECFTEDNLGVKRHKEGLDAMRYFEVLGMPAARDYRGDEAVFP